MGLFNLGKNKELAAENEKLRAEADQLRAALAAAPKPAAPDSPIEYVVSDSQGRHYYGFVSEEKLTVWRAKGIYALINNAYLSISDGDLTEHEQAQNALFAQLAANSGDRAETMRAFYNNSAKLQERLRNCGEFNFLMGLAKLAMVCEGEPISHENAAYWDKEKEARLASDPNLLGFFLPRAAPLNEALRAIQIQGQMDSLTATLSLGLALANPTRTDTTPA
jgi:hypothetical protein